MEEDDKSYVRQHWIDSWGQADAADRFKITNKEAGWNEYDVKEEFDDFFTFFDPDSMVDETNDDRPILDIAMKNSVILLNAGINSGKAK